MAWVEKYVSSQATGGGVGSSADPWTIEEGFSNLAAGMVLYVINDGTYSPTASLAPAAAITSYDPPAMVVGCKSDLSIVLDLADAPVIDFSALASGQGIDLVSSSSYSVFLYGLKAKNAPSSNIYVYQHSLVALCESENAGYGGFVASSYSSAVLCKAINAASYGFSLGGHSCAAFCSYIGTDPPAATAFQVKYTVGCYSINANTEFKSQYHGGLAAMNTAVSTSATRAFAGFSISHGFAALGNIVSGTDNGLVAAAGMLAAFNYFNNVTTPVDNQDASGEGPFEVATDTTTDPQFKDAAAGDYRPTNKDLQALFDMLKQNPGAFPFLPPGGWRPRPRLHGV
ncbi:MAG TPA: hypothetical protein ENK19_10010 [Acidobacteria bacterium]|nr:hypothetical protein [Acidobacteriota bacterium]